MESQGEPNSPTARTILDKRQYDREISFHQLPDRDVPLYQEAERVQWEKWGNTRISQKFIRKLRPRRFVSKHPERETFGLEICVQA